NLLQVPVGTGGNASIFVGGASAQLIADVAGYYTSDVSSGSGLYRSLTPARIADSRSALGLSARLAPGQSASLQVAGQGGVQIGIFSRFRSARAAMPRSSWAAPRHS